MEQTTSKPTETTAAEVRQRADSLIELAAQIERSPVMRLPAEADEAAWHTPRADLCQTLLDRNLHQLHTAADELRQTAFRLLERADEIDAAARSAA